MIATSIVITFLYRNVSAFKYIAAIVLVLRWVYNSLWFFFYNSTQYFFSNDMSNDKNYELKLY